MLLNITDALYICTAKEPSIHMSQSRIQSKLMMRNEMKRPLEPDLKF